ncbi:uncharacterized protein LOC119603780 [Lucilia sericata]|uniref:uncharacterized protein LOC119603780 n=1 Tax=Lucilia sericata TaxID=13632 RepID=UPI0018A849B4|nr:uncharacterized protein LOC119603780 [Lucilia sericata]
MLRRHYQKMSRKFSFLISLVLSVLLYINSATCLETIADIQAPLTTTAPSALTKPRSLRLPNSTYPLHYHWHITTNVHKGDLDFKGNVSIVIDIKESTDEIVLHAKKLRNFSIICYDLETGTQLQDLTYTHDNRTNFLIIHAREYYQVFEVMKKYRLEIHYEGTMNEKHAGLYWLAYQDHNNQTIYHAATQFEPTSARLALPCYDEPAFKANFTIRVTHGKIYNVISNMDVDKVIEHSDSDLSTTTFYTTPLMSTYLVAFVVSNFGFISEEYRNVTQRLYTPPTSKNKGLKQLKFAIRTLTVIEDYLGIAYPLKKLDHIALNKNYGAAMENWGLITYKEDYLLYGDSHMHQRVKDTMTIVHEVSHQWFGDLVSPEWWSYAWLNEGFATYFAHIFIDLLHPEYKSMEYFLIETADRAYSYNEFNMSPHPMTHYVETDRDITMIFDIISYSKAACVIRMFHHAFNQKTFVRGIQSFLTKYQYSVANELQLFDCLQEALEKDPALHNAEWVSSVSNIMMSWTHSKWIPIVNVVRNYEDNTITIKQRSKNPNYNEHWWIPLNFATASNNNFNRTTVDYFMPPIQEVTLNLSDFGIELKEDDWLVVNKQQTGFYHVLYDDENLRRIAHALQQNHLVIHEFNRADLFQNLHSLIEHNEFSIDVIFELLKYLINEDNLLVWNFVSPTVELLERNLYGTPSHELFKQFLKQIIGPIYHKLISHAHSSGKMITDKLHTPLLRMACIVDLPECLEYTRQLGFDYIFQNIEFETDNNDFFVTKDTVLCSACRYLSNEEFNSIIKVVSATDRNTKQYEDILYNLRCTQNSAQIRYYLDIVFGANSTQFIPNQSESLIYVVYLFRTNMMARGVIWQYISKHYEYLVRSPSFVDIFNRIAEFVPTHRRSQFYDLHHKIMRELKSMGEEYSSNLIKIDSPKIGKKVKMSESFLEKFGNDIHNWLLENQMPPPTYAASMMDVQTHNGGAQRFGNIFRLAGNLYRQLYSHICRGHAKANDMSTKTTIQHVKTTFRYHFICWRILGFLPTKNYRQLYQTYAIFLNIMVTIVYPVHLIIGLILSTTLYDAIKNLAVAATVLLCSIKTIIVWLKLQHIDNMLDIINRQNKRISLHKDEAHYFKNVILRDLNRIWKMFMILYSTAGLFGELSVLVNGLWGSWRLMYPAYFVFDPYENSTLYFVAHVYQFIGVSYIVLQDIVNDSFTTMHLALLSGQLRTLNKRVAKLGGDPKKTKLQNNRELLDCIQDHKDLMDINICTILVFLILFASDAFTLIYYFVYFISMTVEILPACYYGIVIEIEFRNLSYALFSSNWLEQDEKNYNFHTHVVDRAFSNMQSFSVLHLALVALILSGTAVFASPYSPPQEFDILAGQENPNARLERVEEFLNYRLPNHTYPEHYDIELTTNVHTGDKAFKGKVTIDVVVVETTNAIVIHARQLKNFKTTLVNPVNGLQENLKFDYELEREFLTLTRLNGAKFEADTKWKVTVEYSGELRTDNGGFYLSSYTGVNGEKRYLATTQFESTDSRHAFPNYDEPAKRANFTITMIHSPTYSAISNMPVNEALSSPGRTVFLTTDKMPSYIVAFIVSDFEHSDGVLNGLPQRVFSHPGTKHEQEWALVSGMLITERLAQYYGVDYMLPKMDQAAIPDFAAGAMENWGLATFREEYTLYNKETSTVYTQTNIARLIAHEFCHLWFGDYVAIQWWSFLWLKEGFATLFAYKGMDDAYPEWGVWQDFHVGELQSALSRDAGTNPRPMTYYVQKPREISQTFDTVSYAKAGSVLHMWNHALTDKVFKQGLHNYLTINKYSAADEEQLFSALQIAAKEEDYKIPATMSEMLSSWSRQGGYPLLTVTRNYNDGTFTVKQEAFYNDETIKKEKSWYIPINYVVASNPDFRDTEASHYLLKVPEIKVNDEKINKDDWLILNKQSTGYYRINYDEQNWQLISDGLINRPYRIHPRNRAQLMHDAYQFSVSKRLDHKILLNMMTYLKQEDQYAPWSTASGIVNAFNRYLSGDVNYAHFKYFVSELVAPIYEKLGVNDVPGEHHYQKYTRNVVINLACLAGVKDCLEETNNKLKAYVQHNITIEPNLQTPIYCNGLKQSGDEEFEFVYNKLMDSNDQALRRALISALGCAQNENHIKKFIYSSIDETNKLRNQERYTLLSPAYSRGEVGLLACIEFLNDNWNAYGNLKSGFGGTNPLDDDIRSMAFYVVNKKQEEKLLALVAKVKNSEHVTANLETSVKVTIKNNFDWLEKNRNPLMSWFAQYHAEKEEGNNGGNDGNDDNGDGGSASLTASSVMLGSVLFVTISRLF